MQRERKTRQTAAEHRRRAGEARPGRRSRGFGGFRKLVALLLLIPTLMVQAATLAPAGAVVVAGFEIDGDTPVNGGGVDWATPVGTFVADPTGNADTSNFGQGAKEFANPSTWQQQTGVAPNQDDISGVYFHSDSVGDDVWGFVGVRRLTTTGVTNFDVEFNAKPNAGATFKPARTPGDVMVRFEQDGNRTFKLTEGYFWRLVSDSAWDADCVSVPGYTPEAGWCKEPSVTSIPFTGATGETGHFAEGAFNFSSLLDIGGIGSATCEGGNFGTMNIRTFTGNADESALKDYVDAVAITIDDSCGGLEIVKVDQFGASVPGATFEISPNPIPGQSASPLVVKDGATPGIDTTADGTITIDPATPGTYRVVETIAPAGYELVQPASARTWTVVVTDDATTWQTGSPGTGAVQTGPFVVSNRKYFKPLSIANEASGSYGVEYDWRVHKTVVGASTKTVDEGGTATFGYQVELEALPEGAPLDKQIAGTVTVTNPNGAGLPAMRATISIAGDLPCAYVAGTDVDSGTPGVQVDVAGGASPTFAYTCDPAAGALVGGTTTAKVSWDQSTYPQEAAHPGEATAQATYAITVQPKIDEFASVSDAFGAEPATPIGAAQYRWSDVWGSVDHRVVVATYSSPAVGGTAGSCTDYTNVARVDESDTDDFDTSDQTVTLCVDLDDLVVTKTANPTFARDYDWTIEKSVKGESSQTVPEGTSAAFEYDVVATPSGGTDTEFVVSGVITVNNPNATAISGVSLVDSLPGATCTIAEADRPLTIPSGTSTFDYSCELPNAAADTTGTNTATATWDAEAYYGTDGSASGEESFDFADAVQTVTDETATVSDSQVELGEVPGGVVLKASDGVQRFTYTKDFDGVPGECNSYDNTATVVENDTQETDDDTETVQVCVEKPLVPEVSGSADLARAYAWSIAKVADATQQTVDGSGTATFTYTVTATAGASTEAGWQVKGAVTIVNPNEYTDGDITADVTAETTLGGGSVCTVTGGQDAEVPASDDGVGSLTLPIACTFSSQPSGSGALNVTTTWDPAGEASSAAAADSTPIVFGVRSETNKTVQVVDDKTVAGQRVVLDPALTWAPGLVKSYTYSLALTGSAAGACQSYTNTATIDLPVGVDPSASAVVLVCTPAPEVLPVQSFGKAVGSVRASCQGTVRASLANRSGETVTYKLRVGKKVHKITVKSLTKKKFVTKGKALAKVTLKVGSTRLDKIRIPALCEAPEVLPDTGLRSTSN